MQLLNNLLKACKYLKLHNFVEINLSWKANKKKMSVSYFLAVNYVHMRFFPILTCKYQQFLFRVSWLWIRSIRAVIGQNAILAHIIFSELLEDKLQAVFLFFSLIIVFHSRFSDLNTCRMWKKLKTSTPLHLVFSL